MNNVQIIRHNMQPVAVVLPYLDYQELLKQCANNTESEQPREVGTPHEVMGLIYMDNIPRLKAWRKYKGYTQKYVASKLGITQSALSQIEKAKNCQKETLEKLAKIFDIPVDLLIFED